MDKRQAMKDAMRASISNGNQFPQFTKEISIRTDVKFDEASGKVGFKYKNQEGNYVFLHAPIKGVIVGMGFRLHVFDSKVNYGINSSLFFSYNDMTVLFSREGKSNPVKASIAKEEMAKIGSVKLLRIIYVLTDRGAIAEVSTNIGLSIEDIYRVKEDNLMDYKVILTPSTFDVKDSDYSQKYISKMSAVAKKNPARYAKITLGEQIEDEKIDEVIRLVDLFQELKKYVQANSNIANIQQPTPQSSTLNIPAITMAEDGMDNDSFDTEPDSDLPF